MKRMEKRSFSHIQLYSDLAKNVRCTAHLRREGGRYGGKGMGGEREKEGRERGEREQ